MAEKKQTKKATSTAKKQVKTPAKKAVAKKAPAASKKVVAEKKAVIKEKPVAAKKDVAKKKVIVEKKEVNASRNLRKQRIGLVTSNKMDKTITVKVERKKKHGMYGKFIKLSTKFAVHDEKNECAIGDLVRIMETRPISKNKRWRFVEVIEKVK